MLKVSYSKVSSYLHCPYKHWLSYVANLSVNKAERPLFFGGDLHKLLQYRHDKKLRNVAFREIKSTYHDLTRRQQADLGDDYVDDLKTVFLDYQEVYKESPLPIETEHEFLIPIGKYKGEPVYFHGLFDEEYKGLRLGEHKTFSTMPTMDLLAMNVQVNVYAKARELEKGKKFKTVQWDYIRSKPAQPPIWLEKSERFSEAANNNITNLSWLRACEEKGIDDYKILSKAENYKQNLSNFFFRVPIVLLPVMVDTIWDDFVLAVREVISKGDTNKRKNVSRDCGWCSYRPICFAEFTGIDVDYVIKKDYVTRERKELNLEDFNL